MERNHLMLGIAGFLLASGAYVTANVAYAEGRDHRETRKTESKKQESKKQDSREREEAGDRDRRELVAGVPHAVTLSNLSNLPLKKIEIEFRGQDRGDFRQTNNCGEELKQKASCTINVTFAPRSPGAKTATMEVHTSGGNQAVYLTGTGV